MSAAGVARKGHKFMYEKKFSMTQEENIFWAKRNLVDYIWKSANLEGIAVTFPEAQTIVEGVSVQGKSIDDINNIVQMKHGWQKLFETVGEEFSLGYVKGLHRELGKMTVINAGTLRLDEVRIAGSSYVPPVPDEERTEKEVAELVSGDRGWTEKALDVMLYFAKRQLFYDGNKRIAMMAANKILIEHGCGILTVGQENLQEFFTLLVGYYEDDGEGDRLKEFLYGCLDGFKAC